MLFRWVLHKYRKAKRRERIEHDIPAEEEERRVNRMRDWYEFCERERDPEKRAVMFRVLFEEDPYPHFTRDDAFRQPTCGDCKDQGLYWSTSCEPRRNNINRRQVEGWVVCSCNAGRARNSAMANMKKQKPQSRIGNANEQF